VSWGGWSPTGSAYAALRQTGVLQTGLAIVGRDGTTEFELALPALSSGVAWSPDGARLAFVVGADVWVVARAGTGSWSLGTVAVGDAIDVTWSPDGAQLAVLRSDGNLQIGGPDATDLRAVGTYPLPVAWGPHGWPFAFVRDGDVWLVDGMASAPRNLTHLPLGGARSAAWSPDGTEIVVSTASGLLVVAPDGSHPRWLEFPAGAVSVAAWSPDSSRFAVDVSGPDQGVLIVNVDGSASIRVDDVMAPVWSPDGRFLLVNGGGGFLIVNADGSGRRALPNASEWETPVWVR